VIIWCFTKAPLSARRWRHFGCRHRPELGHDLIMAAITGH